MFEQNKKNKKIPYEALEKVKVSYGGGQCGYDNPMWHENEVK